MMLNGYGAAGAAVARGRRPTGEDDAEPGLPGRRSPAQAMALGAPLSASFLGLLLMGRDAAAAEAAVPEASGATTSVDDRLPAGAETTPAADSAAPTGSFASALAVVATAAPATAFGSGSPADAGAAEQPAVTRGEPGQPSAEAAAAAGGAAQMAPPDLPDIGDVTLAFGAVEPFVLPEPAPGTPGFPDENLGDLGDPRDIQREPIVPPGDTAGGGAADPGDGKAPIGNPGLRITGTPQNDILTGSDGDDIIDAVGGRNTVFGGAGDDLIYGGTGNDVLRGGPGNDTVYGREGNNTIYGDEGDNRLFGGTGDDTIYGGTGTDRLDGGGGVNRLYAGTGDSTLVINDWRDVAIGNDEGPNGGGVDTLEVAPGFAESLRGRFSGLSPEGKATFVMGATASGRQFPDDINAFGWQVDRRIDNVRLTGEDDHDVVGSAKGDTIWGNDGNNRLYGEDGDDVLYAGGGDNILDGGAGNDRLYAGSGYDQLFGGAGDDILYGGSGESELHGGEGDDLYVFGLAEGGKSTVFDHEGVNRLRFDGLERPEDLAARLDGDDLVLAHNGADIVRLDDYAGNRDAFAGIEHDGEVLSLDQFIREATPGTAAIEADDLLAVFLGPQSVDADDILDPAWLDDYGPAHDAPFALYETTSGNGFAQSDAGSSGQGAGGEDLLGGFIGGEPLWIGPEDGLYVPEAAEPPLADNHQARG